MAAAALIAVAAFMVTLTPTFWVIAVAQTVMGAAAAVIPPAIAAIALGLVGPNRFTHRMARIQAFNHGGNVVAALIAGVAGYFIKPAAVFWLVSVLGILAIFSATLIDPHRIDHGVARGLRNGEATKSDQPSGFKTLLTCRPLIIFVAAITLWQLANAAMLPIVGQKLALQNTGEGTLFMSALAQAVMLPMSVLVGHGGQMGTQGDLSRRLRRAPRARRSLRPLE
jgi:MFS family permease